jgi:hypothetical protein
LNVAHDRAITYRLGSHRAEACDADRCSDPEAAVDTTGDGRSARITVRGSVVI